MTPRRPSPEGSRPGRPAPAPTRLCAIDALAPGAKRRFVVGGRPIVLCRSATGEFFAVGDNCPHQGASLCDGVLSGTTLPGAPGTYAWGREGEILRCPWHAWEFDVRTGASLFGQATARVATYPLELREGTVYLLARGSAGVDRPRRR